MLKHRLIAFSLTMTVMFGIVGLLSANSVVLADKDEFATLNAADGASVEYREKQNGGNAFVRVLKAPFKAMGRLFGRGRKDDNKLHRLTEKDVKRFESVAVTRVKEGRLVASQPSSEDLSSGEHLEQGRALLNEGKLNEAIAELSLATSMDAKLAQAHNLLGVAYDRKGLPEMARKSFEDALKIDKKNAQILNNLGYLLYSNGDYRGAMKRLKKATLLAPDDERILNNLALAQSRLGKFDDAYKSFVRAGGEITGRLNVANRLELAGRSSEALNHYEAAKLRAEAEQKANPNSQAITVVVEIKNGFITFASVPTRRPGLEAYERSALLIARQRRYPADKNGQESIVVNVSPRPAL